MEKSMQVHGERYQRSDDNIAALIVYFGPYLLAWVPPLWYRVMDKALLALPHIDGDLDKVNIEPEKREMIFKKYAESGSASS